MSAATLTPFGTLPKLGAVEWPLLDEVRADVESASGALNAADQAQRDLLERFAREDATLEREVEAAVREGREPQSETAATADVRRRVELRLASEELEKATARHRAAAVRAARTMLDRWDELDVAIEAARQKSDMYTSERRIVDRDVGALRGLHGRLDGFQAVR